MLAGFPKPPSREASESAVISLYILDFLTSPRIESKPSDDKSKDNPFIFGPVKFTADDSWPCATAALGFAALAPPPRCGVEKNIDSGTKTRRAFNPLKHL